MNKKKKKEKRNPFSVRKWLEGLLFPSLSEFNNPSISPLSSQGLKNNKNKFLYQN